MAQRKLIVDCDPGVDDVLALLLALNTPSCSVALISLCFGNIGVTTSVRNVVATFQVLESERQYRTLHKLPLLPYHLRNSPGDSSTWPTVALGSTFPVSSRRTVGAEFFHGADGLGGVHESAPQFSPSETCILPFRDPKTLSADQVITREQVIRDAKGYVPTCRPSWREILRILRQEAPNTVTIVAIAPLSNLARAALEDPATFSRVKEVVCMGGNITIPGNMTPFAEFNFYADVDAAAIVLATTSRNPGSTLPPSIAAAATSFRGPAGDDDDTEYVPVKFYLFPLDITTRHRLRHQWFVKCCAGWLDKTSVTNSHPGESPLATWMTVWLGGAFSRMEDLIMFEGGSRHAAADQADGVGGAYIEMHDPLTMYFAIASDEDRAKLFNVSENMDLRIETTGQWSWGMCVLDRRGIAKRDPHDPRPARDDEGWLDITKGNKVNLVVEGPGSLAFGMKLLERVLGDLEGCT
ncbi:Inosine/uridine-preferring nucleoside hydrolase domain-containing protein [Lipomyces kononenkoae]|uniref:Inosine/uridine-preferring nucleoside hydrolase domain-containing protein n=1 Tax=Lipomyces kononenkoae TaxID=34357 RepID=A0ACC3T4V8_LIPKO